MDEIPHCVRNDKDGGVNEKEGKTERQQEKTYFFAAFLVFNWVVYSYELASGFLGVVFKVFETLLKLN